MLDYNDRAVIQHLRNSSYYHTSACLTARVDAFCDDVPDPGCTCTGAARVEKLVAEVEQRAADRERARRLREAEAEWQLGCDADDHRDHILGSDHHPDDYL